MADIGDIDTPITNTPEDASSTCRFNPLRVFKPATPTIRQVEGSPFGTMTRARNEDAAISWFGW